MRFTRSVFFALLALGLCAAVLPAQDKRLSHDSVRTSAGRSGVSKTTGTTPLEVYDREP